MRRDWLSALRIDKGLSTEEVAKGVGIHRVYVVQIEKGVRDPSVKVAKQYGAFLGFNWTRFFENKSGDALQSYGCLSAAEDTRTTPGS